MIDKKMIMVEGYFNKNLKLLKSFLTKKFYRYLKFEHQEQVNFIKKENDYHLIVNGINLYPEGCIKFCQHQLASYFKNPHQLYYNKAVFEIPSIRSESNTSRDMIVSFVEENSFTDSTPPKTKLQASLIVFGLGSGLFLEELYSRTSAKDIIIVEKNIAHFEAAFKAFSWQGIVNLLTKRKGQIYFCFLDNYLDFISVYQEIIRKKHFGLIEGSYVYMHYEDDFFIKALELLFKRQEDILSYNGWVDDELQHLKNITSNLNQHTTVKKQYLWDNTTKISDINIPVAIIGSGPRLEKTITVLKEVKSHILIVSCGTSLKPLLDNDIEPDFHCEIENIPQLNEFLELVSKTHDISNITLLAADTVTGIYTYFNQAIHFYRDAGGIHQLVNTKKHTVKSSGWSSSVAATAFFSMLGFKDIIFFGQDLSLGEDESHHIAGTYYDAVSALGSGSANKSNMIPIKSNIPSKEVITNSAWLFHKNGFENAINQYKGKVTFYNTGSGASIEGCIYLDNRQILNLIHLKIGHSKREIINNLISKCTTEHHTVLPHFNNVIKNIKLRLLKVSKLQAQHFDKIKGDVSHIDDLYSIFQDICYPKASDNIDQSLAEIYHGSYMQYFHLIRGYLIRHSLQEDCFTDISKEIQMHLESMSFLLLFFITRFELTANCHSANDTENFCRHMLSKPKIDKKEMNNLMHQLFPNALGKYGLYIIGNLLSYYHECESLTTMKPYYNVMQQIKEKRGFLCYNCNHPLIVSSEMLGQRITCKECGLIASLKSVNAKDVMMNWHYPHDKETSYRLWQESFCQYYSMLPDIIPSSKGVKNGLDKNNVIALTHFDPKLAYSLLDFQRNSNFNLTYVCSNVTVFNLLEQRKHKKFAVENAWPQDYVFKEKEKYDLVIARRIFNRIDDPRSFVQRASCAMSSNGHFVYFHVRQQHILSEVHTYLWNKASILRLFESQFAYVNCYQYVLEDTQILYFVCHNKN